MAREGCGPESGVRRLDHAEQVSDRSNEAVQKHDERDENEQAGKVGQARILRNGRTSGRTRERAR